MCAVICNQPTLEQKCFQLSLQLLVVNVLSSVWWPTVPHGSCNLRNRCVYMGRCTCCR